MKKFPTLYKQTSTGKVQTWTIAVKGADITTEFGLFDGKKQTVVETVREGKNIGKANATTPESQAALQAEQEYQGKLKKGYGLSVEVAESTKNQLAAVEPMLAYPIEKKEKYVVFPALAQPKLDGQRMIAVITNGKVKLWSRTQKPIEGHAHIVKELERLYTGTITLDGELYSHKFADDFNELMHLAKHGDGTELQYHVYDVVADGNYHERIAKLLTGEYVIKVKTLPVTSREDLDRLQGEFIADGYEGAMYRNPNAPYENKRSVSLLKVKTFEDAEFKIVGAKESVRAGVIGTFTVVTEDGVECGATPKASLAEKKQFWIDRNKYIGKMATVKFQGKTPDGSLRFPVFKCVREE